MDLVNILLNLTVFSMPIISIIYIFLGKKLFIKTSTKKYPASSFLMFAIGLFLFGFFLELNSLSYQAFQLTRALKYLGLIFIPCFGILFISQLTKHSYSSKKVLFLILLSTLLWLLFVTNPLHHFVYERISFERVDNFSISTSVRALGYYLLLLYFAIYLIFSSLLLIRHYQREKLTQLKHGYLLLLTSMQIFWIMILFLAIGFTGIGRAVSLILLSLFLISFNAIKSDVFELEIKRWHRIFSSIQEVAFLTNKDEALICMNASAKKLYLAEKETLNTSLKDLDQAFLQKKPIKFSINGDPKWFHISKSVFDLKGDLNTYILIDFSKQYQIQEEFHHLSYHDYLTGLYNRRYFEEALKELDTPENLPLTLIIADVNGLKLINDSFGRKQGDAILKKAAKIMKNNVPKNAVVARLSGGEFMMILPQVDVFQVIEIVNTLKSKMLKEKSDSPDISISYGYESKERESQDIHDVFKQAEDDMYRHKVYESTSSKNKTVGLIMNTLYEKSNREMLHSKRVSGLCESIASEMKLSRDDINKVAAAGLMHDIGKIGIDEQILNKEGPLNFEEWQEIQKHPEIGYRILKSASEFSDLAGYVLEHHERWDGKGYPQRLKGDDISLQARIISIADAYDAMTCDRSYRKGFTKTQAIQELRRHSGTQFDPVITKIFIEKVLYLTP